MACYQSAVPKADYTLTVTLQSGNWLTINMKPHLQTVQFCPLKEKAVWQNVEVQETSLRWKGAPAAELSLDRLLSLWKSGTQARQEAAIVEAMPSQGWRLQVMLNNGNSLQMDFCPLLQFPMFAPLSQKSLWKTMQVQEHTLLWQDSNIRLALPLQVFLKYFT